MTFATRSSLSSRCYGFAGSLAIHVALGVALFVALRSGEAGRSTTRPDHGTLVMEMLPLDRHDAGADRGTAMGAPAGDALPPGVPMARGSTPAPKAPVPEGGTPGSAPSETGAAHAVAAPGAEARASPPAAWGADTENFRSRLLRHIERFRGYPAEARRAALAGTARVHFVMDHGGQVDQIWIETSSGSRLLDDAALAAVMKARPLPPPPADWPTTVSVSLPIEFALE
jgi:periplasmic protein TonB